MSDQNMNQNKDTGEQPDTLKNQQFFPGGPFMTPQPPRRGEEGEMEDERRMPPGRGEQFRMGPQPPMGRPPMTAPPNFIPELPEMEGRRGAEFRMGGQPFPPVGFPPGQREMFFSPRDFRRCLNRFTFIWLINGNSFWFFPIFIGRNSIEGFRWRRNTWVYERINFRRIFFFRCF